MGEAQALDWAKIVGPVLGAIVGASLAYFLARGGRRALAYFHLKDVTVIRPELFASHPLTIRHGDHVVRGYVYLTAVRVKNVGINGIAQATVRFTPKISTVSIVSVGITTRSTLLAERVTETPGQTPGAKSFTMSTVASGDSADFNVLLESAEKLSRFEEAVAVELEADGRLGRQSGWLDFVYHQMTPRMKRDEGFTVRVPTKDA